MRIVFMGTPDIAAACLEKLLTEHMNVVAVYTKPDTPQNRGMKLTQSPVKRVALAHEIPVYQPAGGGVALIGITLVPLLSGLFG